jgi:hypothetical protein
VKALPQRTDQGLRVVTHEYLEWMDVLKETGSAEGASARSISPAAAATRCPRRSWGPGRPELSAVRSYEPQAVPVGRVQRPEVPPSVATTHRAGVMHAGPTAVSHDAPSIASSLQTPIWLPLATPVAV